MSSKYAPELGTLLSEVEKKYGRRIATSTDFDMLALAILDETRTGISSSTLKRLWGYVSLNPSPRVSTLDILSRYLGFKSFIDYSEDLVNRGVIESGFFASKFIAVSDLKAGVTIQIGWAPNRLVTLEYLGDFRFRVEDSVNSKLEVNDIFEMSNVTVGYPLVIPRILRNGEYTPSYVAGLNSGISTLRVSR